MFLNFDSDEYYERLRITNKIICSYSRYESFREALPNVAAAANYDLIAEPWVSHNRVYLLDEEGFLTTYILIEEPNDGPAR